MAAGARVAIVPALWNAPAGAAFPAYSSPGVDAVGAGGTAFATSWPATTSGVYVPNSNGLVWFHYMCGATLGGAWQVLIGEAVAGNVMPATVQAGTIAASSSGWIGPFSPQTYNQTGNAPNYTYTGAVNTQALLAAMAGCLVLDITTTTTLAVRAYTVSAAFP